MAAQGLNTVRNQPMQSLFVLFDTVLEFYMWLVILWVVMSWLISFNIVNTHNQVVSAVNNFLNRITEPALRQIRRVVPLIGRIDITPVVLILMIYFLRNLMREYTVQGPQF